MYVLVFFFSSRRRHTRCALVTGFRRVLFRSLVASGNQPEPEAAVREPQPDATEADTTGAAATEAAATETKVATLQSKLDDLAAAVEARAAEAERLEVALAVERERRVVAERSEEHTSELQSLMRISYAVFCLKKKNIQNTNQHHPSTPQNLK